MACNASVGGVPFVVVHICLTNHWLAGTSPTLCYPQYNTNNSTLETANEVAATVHSTALDYFVPRSTYKCVQIFLSPLKHAANSRRTMSE